MKADYEIRKLGNRIEHDTDHAVAKKLDHVNESSDKPQWQRPNEIYRQYGASAQLLKTAASRSGK